MELSLEDIPWTSPLLGTREGLSSCLLIERVRTIIPFNARWPVPLNVQQVALHSQESVSLPFSEAIRFHTGPENVKSSLLKIEANKGDTFRNQWLKYIHIHLRVCIYI